jgi:hypothetical protein
LKSSISRRIKHSHAVVARAAERVGVVFPAQAIPTPAEEVERQEAFLGGDSDDFKARSEGVAKFVDWLFQAGPQPSVVLKRLYVYARAARPELLLNMSGAEIAALFGQTRAAESAREKLILGETLASVGLTAAFGWQKRPSACAGYAKVQLGNRSRAKGRKAA